MSHSKKNNINDEINEYVEEGESLLVYKKYKKISVWIIIISIILLLLGFILLNVFEVRVNGGNLEYVLGIMIACGFIALLLTVGCNIILGEYIIPNRKKKVCNVHTNGEIKVLDYRNNDSENSSEYIFTLGYKYNYRDKTYKVKVFRSANTTTHYKDGDRVELFINPNLPTEIFDVKEYSLASNVFMAIIGVLLAAPALILVLYGVSTGISLLFK